MSVSNWPSLQFSTPAWGTHWSWFNISLDSCCLTPIGTFKTQSEEGEAERRRLENYREHWHIAFKQMRQLTRDQCTFKNNQCFIKHTRKVMWCDNTGMTSIQSWANNCHHHKFYSSDLNLILNVIYLPNASNMSLSQAPSQDRSLWLVYKLTTASSNSHSCFLLKGIMNNQGGHSVLGPRIYWYWKFSKRHSTSMDYKAFERDHTGANMNGTAVLFATPA